MDAAELVVCFLLIGGIKKVSHFPLITKQISVFNFVLEIVLDDCAISDKIAAVCYTGRRHCRSVYFEGVPPAREKN